MALHSHSDQRIDAGWAFRWAVILNVAYVLIEASTTSVVVTVHLVMPGECPADAFLDRTAHDLAEKFGIAHATIQIEQGSGPECVLANGERP
jgi:hypothetical protein